jgi:hypothetical protein
VLLHKSINEGLHKSIVDGPAGLHKSTVFPLWLVDEVK